jgi:hypothetical protein
MEGGTGDGPSARCVMSSDARYMIKMLKALKIITFRV